MTWIVFSDGERRIRFNRDWVASKTLKEFAEHEKHHGLSQAQYKEVHDLAKGKVSRPAKQAPAEPDPGPADEVTEG